MIQIDLEIPKCCDECKFIYDSCCCIITGSRIDWDKFDSERLLDCPLNKIAEPKTAHWIVHPKGIYAHLICDNCLSNAPYDCRTNYCPNCGFRMVEPQEI